MTTDKRYSLGFDYGTESVRVVIVDIATGHMVGQADRRYTHGVIDRTLPTTGHNLPPDYALQHPQDWLLNLAQACHAAMAEARISPHQVVGIGVAFTSCTMLPTLSDGTPLCMLPQFQNVPLAWPKLWKHHGAKHQTDRLNAVAQERREPWLDRYGGSIGLEWFFPKILETLELAPQVYAAAQVWLEAGDFLVWQLTTGPWPHCHTQDLVRSTCQAGYKGCWSKQAGFPSPEFFAAVHPSLADVVATKMPGRLCAPGQRAGGLSPAAAALLELPPGIPVSTAIIDAHAGLPGSGVCDNNTLVMVIGTSSCHLLNSASQHRVPGVAGVVEDGILPGSFGYETGQASVGDSLAWLIRTAGTTHEQMNQQAAALAPGSHGLLAVDWLNGCRTPLMDGHLSGAFIGLSLTTQPAQLYRALIEATAFGLRWIVELLVENGVPVQHFVAGGGLPAKSPLLMQIYSNVLNARISLAESQQSVALGAAILGCMAAGQATTGYTSMTQIIRAMARQRTDLIYSPHSASVTPYNQLYALYRRITDRQSAVAGVMRELRQFSPPELSG
jgi:L-ribulokinase